MEKAFSLFSDQYVFVRHSIDVSSVLETIQHTGAEFCSLMVLPFKDDIVEVWASKFELAKPETLFTQIK